MRTETTRDCDIESDTRQRRIELELGRIHTVTLNGTVGTVAQTTPLTDIQQGIVDAWGVAAPPRVTHLHPA